MGFRTTMESTRPGPGIGVRAGSHRRGHTVAVGLLTAVTAAAYSVFVLAQYYTFRTAAPVPAAPGAEPATPEPSLEQVPTPG